MKLKCGLRNANCGMEGMTWVYFFQDISLEFELYLEPKVPIFRHSFRNPHSAFPPHVWHFDYL
jgi:hypothetical protein